MNGEGNQKTDNVSNFLPVVPQFPLPMPVPLQPQVNLGFPWFFDAMDRSSYFGPLPNAAPVWPFASSPNNLLLSSILEKDILNNGTVVAAAPLMPDLPKHDGRTEQKYLDKAGRSSLCNIAPSTSKTSTKRLLVASPSKISANDDVRNFPPKAGQHRSMPAERVPKSPSMPSLSRYANDASAKRLSLASLEFGEKAVPLMTATPRDFALRRLRQRPAKTASPRESRSPSTSSYSKRHSDLISDVDSTAFEGDRGQSGSPFNIHEPIVIGDYSNPFLDVENANFFQQKMRDAIDLNRYLWLLDPYGFCKRPLHRPFLLRNLSYMQRKSKKKTNNCISTERSSQLPKKFDLIKDSLSSSNALSSKSSSRYLTESGEPTNHLLATSIKFNFIRNNLCFGDRSAIVKCYHVSELDCQLGVIRRIPSASFTMKVNQKLSRVSIDLPDSFGIGFLLDRKSRVEYFVVKVVFRYEDTKVGGGKRLRKVPSRQHTSPSEETATHRSGRHQEKLEKVVNDNKDHEQMSEEVVMFGTKQIVSYSKETGLNVLQGETSIVLHSSTELNISPSNNEWMKDASFLAHIQRLERKTFDNPFMSVQIQNVDDDEEEEDGVDNSKARKHDDECNSDTEFIQVKKEVVSQPHKISNGKSKSNAAIEMRLRMKNIQKICRSKAGRKRKDALSKEIDTKKKSSSVEQRVEKHSSETKQPSAKRRRIKCEVDTEPSEMDASSTKMSTVFSLPMSSSEDYLNMGDICAGGDTSLPDKMAFQFVTSSTEDVDKKSVTSPSFFGSASPSTTHECSNYDQQASKDENFLMATIQDKMKALKSSNDFNEKVFDPSNSHSLTDDNTKSVAKLLPIKDCACDNDEMMMVENVKFSGLDTVAGSSRSTTVVTRVFHTSHLCFFCLNQLAFKTLSSLVMHFRLCHLRFKFQYKENVSVSKSVTLPGFVVSLNSNFNASCEINPTRHYVKYPHKRYTPRKVASLIDPLWIVTMHFAKEVRRNWKSLEKSVENAELYNSSLFKDALMDGGIRCGPRYTFEPPTKINHKWMIQSNSRNLSEITDLHPCERMMMELWNRFLLQIRITLLGKNLVYKAARVFVETHRDDINDGGLRIHFLLHLTNLTNLGCIEEDERYDLFRRLDADYRPLQDSVHFVFRQFDALNREKARSAAKPGGHHRTSSASNLQAISGRATPDNTVASTMVIASDDYAKILSCLESLDDLRAVFPSASTRRLEKLWRFLDVYALEQFKMA